MSDQQAKQSPKEYAGEKIIEALLEPIVERLIGKALNVHQTVYKLNEDQVRQIAEKAIEERATSLRKEHASYDVLRKKMELELEMEKKRLHANAQGSEVFGALGNVFTK
jgi:hypothetical protein